MIFFPSTHVCSEMSITGFDANETLKFIVFALIIHIVLKINVKTANQKQIDTVDFSKQPKNILHVFCRF